MATTCDLCGYRSSELKAGSEIPKSGKRITLSVQNFEDLSRDVIKSDMASVKVPEFELELASGTLGGMVATVEGLITKISENLERVHGFSLGDSIDDWKRKKWQDFKSRLSMWRSTKGLGSITRSWVSMTWTYRKRIQLTEQKQRNKELGGND